MKVITCHIEPDFDAIASAIAAKLLYPDAVLVFPNLPKRSKKNFLIQSTIYAYADFQKVDLDKIDTLIVVDTHQKSRIGDFAKIVDKVKVICFDHHPDGDIDCCELYFEKTGANTTQVVMKLKERNIDFSAEEATLFMLGIYEDTGKLLYPSTTVKDFQICAYLLEKGAKLDIVSSVLEETMQETQVYLLNELIKNARIFEYNNINIVLSFAQHSDYIGEVANIVNTFLSMKKADAAICVFRMQSRIFVIGRSVNKKVDVARILKVFDGGGHTLAASATVKDLTLIEVLDDATLAIRESFFHIIKARDIMSTPAKCVEKDNSVAYCNEVMAKYGINSLIVLNNGELVGIASRPTLQRAIYHNYAQEPVEKFMVTDFFTVSEDVPLSTIKTIIIDQKQRIIPVIKDAKVVGVLTRTNILSLINQTDQKLMRKVLKVDLKLKNKLDEKIYNFFRIILEVSLRLKMKAYAVGGMVRDLIMDMPIKDIDIVVEGNAIEFANEFSRLIEGKLVTHNEFKTASVIKDGEKIDFATARQEYYDEVSSGLPHIEESSLKLDLYRRDFTINTLAISLNENFGELIDYFGGIKDIKDKKIRILHNLSFIEDPTRVFRALRFAEKFNFFLGQQTEKLMKNALNLSVLNAVSKNRLFLELSLILKEEKVVEILKRINEYKIFKYLHKEFYIEESCFTLIESAKDFVKMCTFFCPIEFKIEAIYFSILKFCFRKKFNLTNILGVNDEKIEKIYQQMLEINIFLSKKRNNSEIYFFLKSKLLESQIAAFAISKSNSVKNSLVLYIRDLQSTKSFISGKDLITLGFKPSEQFGKILNDCFEKQIEGNFSSKQEAIDYIKSKYLN
ncbi:MAG: CBS domain-containing protein [Desulfurella sp.]|uniref:CBS domain-containing protein n=1 Tax=Desulfurella sp. TaxID=1962857 RepID=UPI003CB991FB